jgi:hypothetical protein
MEPINIKGTAKTPFVNFDATKGIIELKGRSIPENAIEFYNPIFDWIVAYGALKKEKTIVNMQLEYFNSSSSKCIVEVFKKLETVAKNGSNVLINWYFSEDDEEILNAGEEFKALVKLPFKFIELED